MDTQLVLATLLGVAAVYRITADIVSPDLEGPFNLYDTMRAHISNKKYPAWIKSGIWCRYCISFWVGIVLSIPFGITGMISWWLVPIWAIGLSGPATWYYDHTEMLYPDSGEK